MLLIQEIVREVSVWPDDVLGWFTLAGAVIVVITGTLGAAWAMIGKKFKHLDEHKVSKETFNNHVEDFDKCETLAHGSKARIDRIEYDIQGLSLKHEQVSKEVTIVNESVRELEKLFRTQTDQTMKDIRSMSEAVVRLEGAVSMAVGRDMSQKQKGGNK